MVPDRIVLHDAHYHIGWTLHQSRTITIAITCPFITVFKLS